MIKSIWMSAYRAAYGLNTKAIGTRNKTLEARSRKIVEYAFKRLGPNINPTSIPFREPTKVR